MLDPAFVADCPYPEKHPRHVAAGVIVHLSGMLGYAHGYFVLDLRHAPHTAEAPRAHAFPWP